VLEPGEVTQTAYVCNSVGKGAADLQASAATTTPTPNVGDVVTMTFGVSDSGPDAATNVLMSAFIPAGLQFVSAAPSQGSYLPSTGQWNVGTVTQGSPQTLTVQCRVVTPSPQSVTLSVFSEDQTDPTPADNSATVTITPQQADLSVSGSINNATPNVGDTVTLTFTLSDLGPATATNVSMSVFLAAGLTFVSATPSEGSYDPATGLWLVGTVSPGTPQTLQIQALVVSPNPLPTTASISHADQFDPTTANNSATTTPTPQQADLSVSGSTNNATPNVGDTVTFTFTLSDSGPATATNVSMSVLLAAGLTFVSATPSEGSYDPATGLWQVGTVSPGTPQTLQIQARVVSPNPPPTKASISHADQFDPTTADNSASVP
jgi:uncharacterized repeat protein (TIGR01451 family)